MQAHIHAIIHACMRADKQASIHVLRAHTCSAHEHMPPCTHADIIHAHMHTCTHAHMQACRHARARADCRHAGKSRPPPHESASRSASPHTRYARACAINLHDPHARIRSMPHANMRRCALPHKPKPRPGCGARSCIHSTSHAHAPTRECASRPAAQAAPKRHRGLNQHPHRHLHGNIHLQRHMLMHMQIRMQMLMHMCIPYTISNMQYATGNSACT
jgi:hypothetical protein